MYEKLDLQKIIADAEQYIMENDRLFFRPYMEHTEIFCAKNKLIIGGRNGVRALLSLPIDKDSFRQDIYIINGIVDESNYNICRRLTKYLADNITREDVNKMISIDTLYLQTNIRNSEFMIFCNNRALVSIKVLHRNNVSMRKTYIPALFSAKKVQVIPEELQLAEILRVLYNPAKEKMWNEYKYYADRLWMMLFNTQEVVGGLDQTGPMKLNYKLCESALLDLCVKDPTTILIGDRAVNIMESVAPAEQQRIQIVSALNIDQIKILLPPIVTYKYYDVHLVEDFQTRKYILYIGDKSIADIYNNTTFELIPYLSRGENNIKIGHPTAILRFTMIDSWLMTILGYSISYKRQQKINNLDKPPLENFAGTALNEIVVKKKMIKDTGERFQNYYPVLDNIILSNPK